MGFWDFVLKSVLFTTGLLIRFLNHTMVDEKDGILMRYGA